MFAESGDPKDDLCTMFAFLTTLVVAVALASALPTNVRSRREASCDQTLDTQTGALRTPNYPQEYDAESDCLYKIQPGLSNFSVNFYFCDCELEGHVPLDNKYQCKYDYIQLPNGNKMCGSISGSDIISSTSDTLELRFISDETVNKRGCYVEYSVSESAETRNISGQCLPTTTTTTTTTTPGFWGGWYTHQTQSHGYETFENTSGILKTPNYPDPYDANVIFQYTFSPPGQQQTFEMDFYACDCVIEESDNCLHDALDFGSDLYSPHYCGDLTGRLFSAKTDTGSVYAGFYTDDIKEKKGCQIAYAVKGSVQDLPALCPP